MTTIAILVKEKSTKEFEESLAADDVDLNGVTIICLSENASETQEAITHLLEQQPEMVIYDAAFDSEVLAQLHGRAKSTLDEERVLATYYLLGIPVVEGKNSPAALNDLIPLPTLNAIQAFRGLGQN